MMFEKAVELICEFEGFSPSTYLCPAGVLTIGFGRTYNVTDGDTTTKEREIEYVTKECEKISNQILKLVKVSLTNNQLNALIDFVYNLGIGNFKSSTLLKKINQGDFEGSANEFLRWNKAGGKVLPGLTRRREAERRLFIS